MAQDEILKFLYKKRISGNEYYSVSEISSQLESINKNIRHQVNKLLVYGFLDTDTGGKAKIFASGNPWKRKYRLKNKHIATVERMIAAVSI